MDEAEVAAELARLRRECPRYSIGIVTTGDRTRFIGQRRRPGPGPYTVLTDDLAELREALATGQEQGPPAG
jgi:hypothetical protein